MIIENMIVDGFGKFKQTEIKLESGLNVIYGENEAGKTTLWNFILGMFYGVTKQRGKAARNDTYARYQPMESSAYSGTLEFVHEDQEYRLIRNFNRFEKDVKLYRLPSGKEIVLDEGQLRGVLFEMSKDTFINTLCIGQQDIKTGPSLAQTLTSHMSNLSSSGHLKMDISDALTYLTQEKKKFNTKEIDQEIKNTSYYLQNMQVKQEELEDLQEEEDLISEELVEEIPAKQKLDARTLIIIGALGALFFILLFLTPNKLMGMLSYFLLIGFVVTAFFMRKKTKEGNLPDHNTVLQLEKEKNLEIIRLKKDRLLEEQARKEEVMEVYQNLKKKKEEIEYNLKSIDMAIATIKELSSDIHEDFGGILNQEVSNIVNRLTNGKYSSIKIDENLGIMVEYNHSFFHIDYLSVGTVEQIYFALRLAAAKILAPYDQMPIMIDDIFGSWDESRLNQVLTFLTEYECGQILLFTCKKEIRTILEQRNASFSYISL